jgi:carbon storage regulator
MLVITRREGETVQIGRDIQVMVTNIRHGQCRLAIKAPPEILVARSELLKERKEAPK